jgi:ribosomal protein S18 acetylase RimI-like enzyme
MKNYHPIRNRWTIRRIIMRGIAVLREEGIRSFWFKALGELGYRRLLLFQRFLDQPIQRIMPRIPLTTELLREHDINAYLAFRPDSSRSTILQRFGAGERCFVARYDGQIVCANWAVTEQAWIPYLEREIPMQPGDVYVYDSFTAPAFRNRNIAPALAVEILKYFRGAGYRRMMMVMLPENRANRRARAKTGYRVFEIIRCVRVGSRWWCLERPRSK